MLAPNALSAAFSTYWTEIDRCIAGRAYWALLHVTVCLPDICAALESPKGETSKARYVAWCDSYLPDPFLTGEERYWMRCKVLHQGRATTDQPLSRYEGFSFGQPTAEGVVDHNRVDGKALNLDVGRFAAEVREGVVRWIGRMEANALAEALNVESNLPALIQVRQLAVPATGFYGKVPVANLTTISKSS